MRGADPDKARRGDARKPTAADATNLGLQFQPVWDVKHEAITTYYAEPVDGRTGERIAGYQFEEGVAVSPGLLEIDEAVLRTSEVVMRSMFESGKKAIIGVPVHISSLVKLENRSRILQTISQLDPALCKYRAIKLSGIVPGFPRLYLRDTLGFLAAHIPSIVVSMSAATDDFSTAVDCEASTLAYTLPPGHRVGDDPAFFNKLRRDTAIAHSRFKRILVEGPLTAHQAGVSARCGIDSPASPLVWPATRAPAGVLKWAGSRLSPAKPPC